VARKNVSLKTLYACAWYTRQIKDTKIFLPYLLLSTYIITFPSCTFSLQSSSTPFSLIFALFASCLSCLFSITVKTPLQRAVSIPKTRSQTANSFQGQRSPVAPRLRKVTELFSFTSIFIELTRFYKSKMRFDPLSNMKTRAARTDQVSVLIEHTEREGRETCEDCDGCEGYEGCKSCGGSCITCDGCEDCEDSEDSEGCEGAEYEGHKVAIYNALEQRTLEVLEQDAGEQKAAAQYSRAVAEYVRTFTEHEIADRHVRAAEVHDAVQHEALEEYARSSAEYETAKQYARVATEYDAAGRCALAIKELEAAEQHAYVYAMLTMAMYYARKAARFEVVQEYARQVGLRDAVEQNALQAMKYRVAEYRAREKAKPQAVEEHSRVIRRIKHKEFGRNVWISVHSNFKGQMDVARDYARRMVIEDAMENEIRDVTERKNEAEEREITEQIAREVAEQENRLCKAR
jgi:hypothetical protein